MSECHCGKDGHPFGSINCPVHGSGGLSMAELVAEHRRLRRFVDFVNLWCNRRNTDDEARVSAIKHHPTARAALIERGFTANRGRSALTGGR